MFRKRPDPYISHQFAIGANRDMERQRVVGDEQATYCSAAGVSGVEIWHTQTNAG